MNKKYSEYLKSAKWKAFRKQALIHYGSVCSKCPSTTKLQVHHLTYINIFKETLADVVILCKSCHGVAHAKKPKTQKPPRVGRNARRKKLFKKQQNSNNHFLKHGIGLISKKLFRENKKVTSAR